MNGDISVLLVDDEPAVADLAAAQLERIREDITVEVEASVETALARFERDPETVDCIVSDYTMAGMDGLEFLAAVRDAHPDVPFILFTGKGSEDIASEAISAGVTDYLQKGTETEQYELLANRITNAVEGYRAERRADELARINGVISDVQRELVRQPSRSAIEEHVCARLADSEPYTLAWMGTPDDGVFAVRERAGTGEEYLDAVTIRADDTPRGRGPAGTALRTGEVQVARNITEVAAFAPWREAAERYEHGAVIVLPLSYDDSGYGVLAIYSDERYAFCDEEQSALAELGGTVAQAIHTTETRTRLERREHALTESERKYRSLIDAAPDAIFVAEADTGEIVETNAAAEDLLGCSREEIIGLHQSDLHPDGECERYRDLFERHLNADDPGIARFEDGSYVFVVRADGERVPVEISAAVVEVGDRTLVHGLFRDVSARREREQELRGERAVTEGLFEAMPDPICVFDSDGRMLRWNDEFASVVGYSHEEIAGMNCHEFVPSEDRDRIREQIESVVAGDESVTVESALVTKSGESIPHEFSGARLTAGESVRGVIITGRNVTERRQRERTVAALHEATRDLVAAEDRAGVAETITDAAAEILGFPIAVVRLHDHETDPLEPIAVTDTTGVLGELSSHARGESLPWRALRAGEPVVTDDDSTCHQLYVPLGTHGTISIATPTDAFEDSDIRLARVLAANAAVALDRIEREERLHRYERMLDAAGDSIYALDTEGRFTAVNDTLVTVTGYAREELVGEHVSMVLGAEDVELGESLIRRLLSNETAAASNTYEVTAHTAAGDTVPCEAQIALLHADGEFDGTVGVVRDITARKRHEEMLESLHDATREMMTTKTRTAVAAVAVETAEQVLDMPLNGIWLHDEDAESLQPVAVSEGGRDLFETIPTYTADGESLSWETFETGETRRYDRVDREPKAYNPETPARSELLVPLGTHGVMTIGSTEPGQFDESDVSLAKLLAANTEAALNRAERERELRERERELERQNELLDEFASVISHDLRNPMSVVRGRLELAQAESPTEHHEEAMWAVDRMDALIEDVLTLARQGRIIGDTERVSLATVAETAWRTVGTETASLVVENPGTVEADPDRLARLFENLFRNAVEHAGEDVTVVVGPSEEGFFVADDGPGIPDGEREKIFEHGYSTSETGTGLGLMIVRSIAEAHGWAVHAAESETGARFEIST